MSVSWRHKTYIGSFRVQCADPQIPINPKQVMRQHTAQTRIFSAVIALTMSMFGINMLIFPPSKSKQLWYWVKYFLSGSPVGQPQLNSLQTRLMQHNELGGTTQSHAFCKSSWNSPIKAHSLPVLAANTCKTFQWESSLKGSWNCRGGFKSFEKKRKWPPAKPPIDWLGWCRGTVRVQLWLIGHCGALWEQQHSSAGQHNFSSVHHALSQKDLKNLCRFGFMVWVKAR